MTRELRKQLINSIQEKRNSKVITYITSDRHNLSLGIQSDIVPVIHDHILAMKPEDRKKLDLFIYSRGGDSDVPWTIVSMFREYCEEGSFSILVPFRAHSAATVIALGADEIIMTKKAELGPIDITIERGPYNPTDRRNEQILPVNVEDVMGYFSLLERVGCERPEEVMRGFEQLTRKVHPLVLGTVSRLLEQTKLVALRLLSTRADAFPEERNREIVKRLSSEIYSHRHAISRTEAISYLQLEQVVKAEDAGIADELWQLYTEYRDIFELDEPFKPEEHLITNNLDAHTWENLNLVCVESIPKITLSQRDIQVRRLRSAPPNITLNLEKLSFPTINFPNLPDGLTPEHIQRTIEGILPQIVNPVISRAIQEVADKYFQSLPSQFERLEYNVKWNTEE